MTHLIRWLPALVIWTFAMPYLGFKTETFPKRLLYGFLFSVSIHTFCYCMDVLLSMVGL